MISFSSLSKRRGTTLAGVFSLALSCVLLLCGAGSVPIENLLPQGAMQGDLNAGGHNLTNAATVYATAVNATSVAVSGTLTAPSSFTLPFSKLTSTPTTLSGYGITDPIVLTGGSYANPAWLTSLAASKLTGALPAISGASLTGLTFSQIGGTPTTLSGYGITDGEPALGNPSTSGYVLSSTTGGTRSWIAAGGSLTLDSSVTAVGFSYGSPTAGTLYLANVNAAGGLAQIGSDSPYPSISFLGTVDSGFGSVAIGTWSSAGDAGAAVGWGARATAGGGAIGSFAWATTGGAVGGDATETAQGGAVGANTSATSGFAGGLNAVETAGGVQFCSGINGTPNSMQFKNYPFFVTSDLAFQMAAGSLVISGGAGSPCVPAADVATAPSNTTTPVGWLPVTVNGTSCWIPYYQ